MARPKKYIISLSETDVNKLQTIIHKKDTSKSIIRRCQILLELDENTPSHLTQMQIANAFGVCKATVSNIVKHYI
ncbi:helix-turn-helix domain-containing protein [Lachnospiraceae bacterium 45-W7]